MLNSITKLIIGDLDEKKAYKQMMKRVDDLPKDYKIAFKGIQKYINTVGPPSGDMSIFKDLTLFLDLITLFETSASEKREVIDVIGSDIDKFTDEFMAAYVNISETRQEKLNREIMEKFNKEVN